MAGSAIFAIDGDSPTSEGILTARVQIMDAFDAAHTKDLQQALNHALGPEIPEATLEPDNSHDIRGGAYLLGSTHRRAWRVRWQDLPAEMRRHQDRDELEAIKDTPAELILQWADNVPFAVVLVRAPFPCDTWRISRAAEGLLEALPGRLGPSNRIPRSETQIVICAKISDERMQRIRDRMEKGGKDKALSDDLSAGLRSICKVAGSLRLESAAPNHLIAEGYASSGNDRAHGPFRAFVYSKGNLGPHSGWEWLLPIWIPSGLGSHDWTSFDFHPFLIGAIRHARHIAVEVGRVDEALGTASRRLPGNDAQVSTEKVPKGLHRDLVALHTRAQRLSTAHHMSSTRSQISQGESEWPGHLRYQAQAEEAWPMVPSTSVTSDALKATKVQVEQEARQVLEAIERRLDRALDLVAIVESRNLNRSMWRWNIAAVMLAAAGVVLAVVLRS